MNKIQGILPHLGLGYVGAVLAQQGHSVSFLDAKVMGLDHLGILQWVRHYEPDLIGLSTMTPSVHSALELSGILRAHKYKVMIGGVHASLFPDETRLFADQVYIGEFEAFVDGHLIVENLDSIPMPIYHKMPMQKYSSITGLYPVAMMMTSRGCPYKCTFCYKTPSDIKYRRRSAEGVVDEMKYLVDKFGVKEIMFYDDIMVSKHILELCEMILMCGVKVAWETPQRVGLVKKPLLKLMKRAGCRMLRYGVEQGNEKMMQKVKNDPLMSKEYVREIFAKTREAGIDTFAYFLVGYLGETPDTIRETIDFAMELNPRHILFTKVVPLPGTPLHEEAVAGGFIDENYWRDYSLMKEVNPIKDFVPDADRWVREAYRKFYMRPSKIASQFFQIRSLRDLKNNIVGAKSVVTS